MLGTLPTDYKQQELKARAAAEAAALANINTDGGYHKDKFGYKPSQFIRSAVKAHLATKGSQNALKALSVVAPAFKAATEFTIPGMRELSTAMEMYGPAEDQAVKQLSDATNIDPLVLRGIEAAVTLPFVSKNLSKIAAKAPGVSQLRGAKTC